jgi:hypothetical protein
MRGKPPKLSPGVTREAVVRAIDGMRKGNLNFPTEVTVPSIGKIRLVNFVGADGEVDPEKIRHGANVLGINNEGAVFVGPHDSGRKGPYTVTRMFTPEETRQFLKHHGHAEQLRTLSERSGRQPKPETPRKAKPVAPETVTPEPKPPRREAWYRTPEAPSRFAVEPEPRKAPDMQELNSMAMFLIKNHSAFMGWSPDLVVARLARGDPAVSEAFSQVRGAYDVWKKKQPYKTGTPAPRTPFDELPIEDQRALLRTVSYVRKEDDGQIDRRLRTKDEAVGMVRDRYTRKKLDEVLRKAREERSRAAARGRRGIGTKPFWE